MVKLINENSDSKRKSVVEARIGRTKQVCVSQEYVPGYGWEDITVYDDNSYESRSQARQDAKGYRDNGFSARVITRRISNPAYVEPEYESKQRTRKRSIKESPTRSMNIDMWYGDPIRRGYYGADAYFNDLSATYSGNIYDPETGEIVGDYTCDDSTEIEKMFNVEWN